MCVCVVCVLGLQAAGDVVVAMFLPLLKRRHRHRHRHHRRHHHRHRHHHRLVHALQVEVTLGDPLLRLAQPDARQRLQLEAAARVRDDVAVAVAPGPARGTGVVGLVGTQMVKTKGDL